MELYTHAYSQFSLIIYNWRIFLFLFTKLFDESFMIADGNAFLFINVYNFMQNLKKKNERKREKKKK